MRGPEAKLLPQKIRQELLFDFYGNLLTERQRQVLELHWDGDFSLGEVAENLGVSRQAIYYAVKSAERSLEHYEEKLELVAQFQDQRHKVSALLKRLEQLEQRLQDPEICHEVRSIRDALHLMTE